jgi:hypothetical protein
VARARLELKVEVPRIAVVLGPAESGRCEVLARSEGKRGRGAAGTTVREGQAGGEFEGHGVEAGGALDGDGGDNRVRGERIKVAEPSSERSGQIRCDEPRKKNLPVRTAIEVAEAVICCESPVELNADRIVVRQCGQVAGEEAGGVVVKGRRGERDCLRATKPELCVEYKHE